MRLRLTKTRIRKCEIAGSQPQWQKQIVKLHKGRCKLFLGKISDARVFRESKFYILEHAGKMQRIVKFYQKSVGRNFISVLFFALCSDSIGLGEKNPFTNW